MRKAELPNGQILVFPDETSDAVIRSVVERITNNKSDTPWSSDQVKTIIQEMNSFAGKLDEAHSKIDYFGPAIESQNEIIDKQTTVFEKHVQVLLDGYKAQNQTGGSINKSIESVADQLSNNVLLPVLKDIARHVIVLANNVEKLSVSLSIQNREVTTSIKDNHKAVVDLIATQEVTNTILSELVKVLSKDKTVVRNKQGEIVKVELR